MSTTRDPTSAGQIKSFGASQVVLFLILKHFPGASELQIHKLFCCSIDS